MQTIIRNTRGRNRSKQPSELPYYLLVMLVGLIVGVAIYDLLFQETVTEFMSGLFIS